MTAAIAGGTKIQWCDETFSPWWGCEKVSPGCAHCYAEGIAKHRVGAHIWGPGHGYRWMSESTWKQPLMWARRSAREGRIRYGGAEGERIRVFCASMADVFEDRPELVSPRERLFDLIAATPELDWLVLTKRPELVVGMLDDLDRSLPPNVWLGTSIENARFTWRADVLREIPAAVRFISAEPLLGSLFDGDNLSTRSARASLNRADPRVNASTRRRQPLDLTGIDWVIVGGESGPKARPFHLEHAREIVRACRGDHVESCERCGNDTQQTFPSALPGAPDRGEYECSSCGHTERLHRPAVFVKQLGAKPVDLFGDRVLMVRDSKGGDITEWPPDVRVREFPRSAA